MGNKSIKGVQEARSVLAKHAKTLDTLPKVAHSPAANALRAIENSAVRRILEDVNRHNALMKAAVGPFEDLRRAGAFDLPSRRVLEQARRMMVDFEARFRLPEVMESARLVAEFQVNPLSETLQRYAQQASSIQRAMEAMRTPWLDAQKAMRSMGGFAKLQGIGHALSNIPTFDDRLITALRVDLGDWRDRITWPENILTDITARSEFYLGLGFDPALTDCPAPAFEQSLDIAGLRQEPPPLVDRYGGPIPPSDDADEEEGLRRTNIAHDWLLRLETQLRRFIDEKMIEAFGKDWPKHRLPNGVYEMWQEKERKARQEDSRDRPLIAYADFTDYELVICKHDNWREVFAPFFGRRESVLESFQRLYPVRLDTMHARPITLDDELLLRVETKRLVRVMIRSGR